jgi:hypothetical protein
MVKKFVKWLSVASKKIKDSYNPKSYTWRMVLVPKPTVEQPYPCILVTLSNGFSKVLLRVTSLEEYDAAFTLSVEERAKIEQALKDANSEADRIEEDMRLLMAKRSLAAGAKIVNTGTGEVLAEAERIVSNASDK